ncbi:hypothetical protein HMPREF1981_02609 [Bacteroides pyogenes F0041]|uniref:Uncharacterized protein n=1 Tax=Bacteroides pyogenes F0041 TaxID=1321819 RepID=U2DQH2_9BACE|nr:hypothetical protein HMPREF1981_02609 [Bacteroides pyogenes F0041]
MYYLKDYTLKSGYFDSSTVHLATLLNKKRFFSKEARKKDGGL